MCCHATRTRSLKHTAAMGHRQGRQHVPLSYTAPTSATHAQLCGTQPCRQPPSRRSYHPRTPAEGVIPSRLGARKVLASTHFGKRSVGRKVYCSGLRLCCACEASSQLRSAVPAPAQHAERAVLQAADVACARARNGDPCGGRLGAACLPACLPGDLQAHNHAGHTTGMWLHC